MLLLSPTCKTNFKINYLFQQTMFKHPREAQAILQEQVTYHMMKGGIRMGIKLGIIVTLYFGACQVI